MRPRRPVAAKRPASRVERAEPRSRHEPPRPRRRPRPAPPPRPSALARTLGLFDRRWAKLAAVCVVVGTLASGAYAAAVDTSMFALRNLQISGGSAALDAQVREALAPELGVSLLRISGAGVDRIAATLPDVISLRFVRSFPDTLHVSVVPERPVLLLRRGRVGFIVSARGRVMSETRDPAASALPRLYITKAEQVVIGSTLDRADGLLAAAAAAAIPPGLVSGGVRFVTEGGGELTLVTPSGFQIRLGDNGELGLKLAIAQKIAAQVDVPSHPGGYIDVSVPERPVFAAQNSQVPG